MAKREKGKHRGRRKVALLIDAENVSSRHADEILSVAERLGGHVTYQRAYGDWGKMTGWRRVAQERGIEPVQVLHSVPGKCAADFRLTIDAMDMLRDGDVDVLAVASSDSDYTALARRARNSGAAYVGVGEGSTPQAYRIMCDDFHELAPLPPGKRRGRAADRQDA